MSELEDASSAQSPLTSCEPPTTDAADQSDSSAAPVMSRDGTNSFKSFYIEVPKLSVAEKATYTSFNDRTVDPAVDFRGLESIIGEYRENDRLYYYAKFSDGFAHKFPSERFKPEHSALVEDYKRKKRQGTLPNFDPTASYIHPTSRAKLILQLSRAKAPAQTRRTYPDSDEAPMDVDESSEGDGDSDAYSDDGSQPALRRSTRAAAAKGKGKGKKANLPFSPKKTRSRHAFVIHDSDDSGASVTEVMQTRRSNRTKKAARDNLADAEYRDDVEPESDDYAEEVSKPKRARGRTSRKVVPPEYGRIREIADLNYDSDVETASLRAHRYFCEKCSQKPTHELLKKKKKGRKKSRTGDGGSSESEGTKLAALGGWVRCVKCPVSAHWGCLSKLQRDEILRAAFEKDKAEWRKAQAESGEDIPDDVEPVRRKGLGDQETTEFLCGSCKKGSICMICKEVAVRADIGTSVPVEDKAADAPTANDTGIGDVEMVDGTENNTFGKDASSSAPGELVFRCPLCKRAAHYAHLPVPPSGDQNEVYPAEELAAYYQSFNNWRCADCVSYVYQVESILAWRPYPENAVEPPLRAGELPNYQSLLPREYLVKWADRSYRRTQWVPHGYLLALHRAKLKNFFENGTRVPLLPEPVLDDAMEPTAPDTSTATFGLEQQEIADESREQSKEPNDENLARVNPMPDAERRIPPAWKTVDRVLDVLFWYPEKRRKPKQSKKKGKKNARRVDSEDSADDEEYGEIDREYEIAFRDGEQPSEDLTETVEEWESRTRRTVDEEQADCVVWTFVKWRDLGYDSCTWDTPPREGEPGYAAFQDAFARFVKSRSVTVPIRSRKEVDMFDNRKKDLWKSRAFTETKKPELGQSNKLSLMPFQIDGVNWLCNNWWNLQHCILADEMGLGKTVQIVTFLGVIMTQQEKAFPALVVVPNSTLTNWVREFERWAPTLRVCPFYGESKAREIIKRYELSHTRKDSSTTGAKYHVLVTTYETVTNTKEFGEVFKKTPRWEVLVVDEGQRLKSDSSHIFKRLKELKTTHRIILTGTPLNNNLRELFNLMNFLDPHGWDNLEELEQQHAVLTEESVKELHERLRPYFLRRIKSEVLELPPKNEVIVPVSMAPLQKEIYRSILSQNVELLKTIAQGVIGSKVNAAAVKRTNLNNILMQLRKCLQHPYLISRDIEPAGLSEVDAHEKLIDASAKLRMLKMLLPKLQARGHRVLLFSQFVIALDIIEDFLRGEGFRYQRLDGNTKQAERQKSMDEFNKPNSDYFIFLLSTRAGGVGINLWSADTVIIFDPDFNPHQDLQAIARAHRYGQKKTCLVFKFMVKDSAEDRIMQAGKKKLVLDHLIVQKMDDDDTAEDVQSILTFGAQALFDSNEQQAAREITYSDHDIDNLISKTETEGEQVESKTGEGTSFSFAKVWSADRDALEEMQEQSGQDQEDSWARTLERIAAERAKERAAEVTGRGARRRAAPVFPHQNQNLDIANGLSPDKPLPKKNKGKKKDSKQSEDSDVYAGSEVESDGDSTDDRDSVEPEDFPTMPAVTAPPAPTHRGLSAHPLPPQARSSVPVPPLSPIVNRTPPIHHHDDNQQLCGLCGTAHEGGCFMTHSSVNLAQYRKMLITHAGDETLEERQAAIAAIDETLHKRGQLHLIYGQPLHLVLPRQPAQPPAPRPPSDYPLSMPPSMNAHSRTAPTPQQAHIQPHAVQSAKRPNGVVNSVPPKPKPRPLPRTANATPAPVALSGAVAGPSKHAQPATFTGWADPSHNVAGPSQPGLVKGWTDSRDAVAGPPKRALSPPLAKGRTEEPPKRKKTKEAETTSCAVCGQIPHLVKDCPLIKHQNSQRIQAEIQRLQKDPTKQQTVTILERILTKRLRREQAANALSMSSGVVVLSD